MAVTNLGGGGVLETTTAGQRQTTDILSRLALQQRGINAEAAAKQKEVDQATWTAAMQNYAQPFLNQGLSMGYVIEQNPELFRQALGNIMGSPEQAEAYMKQTMGAEETVEQASMRQLFSQFKTNEEKFGLLNHLSGMTPEQKVQFAQEQQTAPPTGDDTTLGASDLFNLVRSGEASGVVDAEMKLANFGGSLEQWIETPQAAESRALRGEIWKAYGLEGDYTGKGDQNKQLEDAIRGGNPQKVETQGGEINVSPGMQSLLSNGRPLESFVQEMRPFSDPSFFQKPYDKDAVKDYPTDNKSKATEYLNIIESVHTGEDSPAMNFEKLPPAEKERFNQLVQEFDGLTNDEILEMTREPISKVSVQKDLSDLNADLSFDVPPDLSQGASAAAQSFMTKGALSRFNDMASQMVAQGGRAAVPILYESMLKEAMDSLDISEKEAKTGLAIAQTQSLYDSIAQGRLVDSATGKPVNYTPTQNDAINAYMDGLRGNNFIFKFEDNIPSGFSIDKKDYSKEEWDSIASQISAFSAFSAANPDVRTRYVGDITIGKGDAKGQKMPVYIPIGSYQGTSTGAPTNADALKRAVE